jgi:hypothetical protein
MVLCDLAAALVLKGGRSFCDLPRNRVYTSAAIAFCCSVGCDRTMRLQMRPTRSRVLSSSNAVGCEASELDARCKSGRAMSS